MIRHIYRTLEDSRIGHGWTDRSLFGEYCCFAVCATYASQPVWGLFQLTRRINTPVAMANSAI